MTSLSALALAIRSIRPWRLSEIGVPSKPTGDGSSEMDALDRELGDDRRPWARHRALGLASWAARTGRSGGIARARAHPLIAARRKQGDDVADVGSSCGTPAEECGSRWAGFGRADRDESSAGVNARQSAGHGRTGPGEGRRGADSGSRALIPSRGFGNSLVSPRSKAVRREPASVPIGHACGAGPAGARTTSKRPLASAP